MGKTIHPVSWNRISIYLFCFMESQGMQWRFEVWEDVLQQAGQIIIIESVGDSGAVFLVTREGQLDLAFPVTGYCVFLDSTGTEARTRQRGPRSDFPSPWRRWLAFMSLHVACTLAIAWSARSPVKIQRLSGLASGTYCTSVGADSCNRASSSATFASIAEFLSLREASSSSSVLTSRVIAPLWLAVLFWFTRRMFTAALITTTVREKHYRPHHKDLKKH